MKRESVVLTIAFLMFVAVSFPMRAQVSFFQPPTYAGSGNVFVADFNGDGKQDILTSDGTMNLGNGDGTFTPGTSVSVSSGQVLAVADFNGDGKPDVLEQGTGTLLVLLGNGDGTFKAPLSTASGASLSAVAAIDLNGDGKADVVGVFNSSLMVYISNGDGTFKSGVSYNIGVTPAALLSLGDFNGDGKTDVALSSGNSSTVGEEVVFLGNGDGTFQSTPKTSAGIFSILDLANAAAVGDFNGDGKLDLAVSGCNAGNCSYSTVYIFAGNGDGTFQAPSTAISASGSLAALDFNGDGKLDLIVSTAGPTEIYLGNGDGTFSNNANYPGSCAAVADFNGDGKPDIAGAGAVLLGNGNGTFQGVQQGLTPGNPIAAVVGDFAKTGTPDVAVVSSDNVYILKNNGSAGLSLVNTYTLQQPGYAIVTADFNGDGNLDLMVISTATSDDWSYCVLLGNGDGSFQSPVFYPQSVITAATGYSIVVADFNKDNKLDVAISMAGAADNQSLALLLGNGDGTFAAPSYVYDDGAQTLLAADFNGDGKLDIAAGFTNGTTSGTALLLGNGDGTFQAAVFPTSLNGFVAQFTADLNNDGNPDLVSGNWTALGNGDGTFTLLPLPSVSYQVSALADLNGDGKPDELVTYYGQSVHAQNTGIILGNGDGTFGPLIDFPTSGLLPIFGAGITSTIALIADMNGDGRPDIVFSPTLVSPGTGIAVMLNTTSPGFGVLASALSPAPVTAGNSATATVTVSPAFGFSGTVALSCTGLPRGATCALNPPSIANSSGTSALTISTTGSLAAGTYPVQVTGTAGSIVNSMSVSLVVQAAPGFSLDGASGSPTSQTISAGQTASFGLALAPTGSFTGTVNLSCAITPSVTPAPTCTLSSSSVQISGSGAQPVTVKVATTAGTTGTAFRGNLPPGTMPLTWSLLLLGSAWLWARNRKRWSALAASMLVLTVLTCVSCGGSGSSSSHTTTGTPTGNYAVTITASSGGVSHSMPLQVVVQ
jgi:hypothetical protein